MPIPKNSSDAGIVRAAFVQTLRMALNAILSFSLIPLRVASLLGLTPEQMAALNDDRVGRSLDRLFDCDTASLALAVVGHATPESAVRAAVTYEKRCGVFLYA